MEYNEKGILEKGEYFPVTYNCTGRDRIMKEIVKRWKNGEIGVSMLNIAIEMDENLYEEYFDREYPGYCTQNDGTCSICSLVNYGLDCHNNKIGKSPNIAIVDDPECAD